MRSRSQVEIGDHLRSMTIFAPFAVSEVPKPQKNGLDENLVCNINIQ